jgi:hypothetical protein
MEAAKRQEAAAVRHVMLAVADLARLFGCIGESCFLYILKLPNGMKRLEDW